MAVNQFKKNKPVKNEAKDTNNKDKKVRGNSFFKKVNNRFTGILKNEKLAQIIGLLLMVLSVFLLLAFSSYLFTWKADQNLITHHWDNPDRKSTRLNSSHVKI